MNPPALLITFNRSYHVRRLARISRFGVAVYQLYRRLTGKTRTPLQMYFGQ